MQLGGSLWNTGGAVFSGSTSDTAQITFKAAPYGGIDLDRRLCIHSVPSVTDGYYIRLGFSGGNGGRRSAMTLKPGTALFDGGSFSWSITADHAVRIVASGTTAIAISVYVDGILATTVTDNTSPLGAGHPGLLLVGERHFEGLRAIQFKDF